MFSSKMTGKLRLGLLDIGDAFPLDPTETTDMDGDGMGDNSDAFPSDPTETVDTDGDGQRYASDREPAKSASGPLRGLCETQN